MSDTDFAASTKAAVPLDSIVVRDRLRPLDDAKVAMLKASIEQIGLRTPISVFAENGSLRLIAGQHRLEACKLLGHELIPAEIMEMSELNRQLWEIDENLMRAELSPAERARHVARRKELYETLHPEKRAGVAGGKARQGAPADANLAFAADAATKYGASVRSVQRDAQRGEHIDSELIDAIIGTKMDHGVELDALAQVSAQEQRAAVDRVLSGDAPTARVALEQGAARSTIPDISSLRRAWQNTSPAGRRAFIDWIKNTQSALLFERGLQGITDAEYVSVPACGAPHR